MGKELSWRGVICNFGWRLCETLQYNLTQGVQERSAADSCRVLNVVVEEAFHEQVAIAYFNVLG